MAGIGQVIKFAEQISLESRLECISDTEVHPTTAVMSVMGKS